jgi:FKBP-type peptidyl-prolyl cis-trans isomerase 2
MAQVKEGDKVKVHYRGTLNNGEEFDSSAGRAPLEFEVGTGQVIAGFDKAVVGMSVGDSRDIKIPVEEAYGPHRDELVLTVDREMIPENINPGVGDGLVLEQDEQKMEVIVTEVTDKHVTMDGNHPLAGEELNFSIELVEIT